MFAIDDVTATAVIPTPEAAGTPGYFTEGNPGTGTPATYLRASFLNALQTELLNILTAAGVTPSKTVYTQLLTSFRSNTLITAVDTGTANTCVIAFTPVVTALTDGMILWFKAKVANTGATTLNVNGLGATPVVGGAHAALQGGEIIANGKCQVVYNSTLNSWVLIECTGAALQVGAATQSNHALSLGQAAGRLQRVRVFTTTQVYTPTLGTSYVRVLVVGGGGGGGSAQGTVAAQSSSGSGGGGGGWARKLITSGFSGVTITVGAAGGQASTPNPGGSGGSTSFGALLSATGGTGGSFGASTSSSSVFANGGANGGTGSLGDENGLGVAGLYAFYGPNPISGKGGGSYFGDGASGISNYATGLTASVYGSGGSGGNNVAGNAGGATSGAGAQGICLVEEYA